MLTYMDQYDKLMDHFQLSKKTGQVVRNALRSVPDGFLRLMNEHDWMSMRREMIIHTSPDYNTGTVEFDLASRTVTLTDGVFPAWADMAYIRLENIWYRVGERVSDTEVKLLINNVPEEDISSGATYLLSRSDYLLPEDFKSLISIVVQNAQYSRWTSYHKNVHQYQAYGPSGIRMAVTGSSVLPGRMVMMFGHSFSDEEEIHILYQSLSRPIKYANEYKGTATVANSSTPTVTASTAFFQSDMVGSVLRLADNGDNPVTGLHGGLTDKSNSTDNPYIFEGIIQEVVSPTEVTMDKNVGTQLTGVSYCVTDPIYIPEHSMRLALDACVVSEYARKSRLDDRHAWEQSAKNRIAEARENASSTYLTTPFLLHRS